jgi:hypothetical protein
MVKCGFSMEDDAMRAVNERPILIHVGIPRAASNWLQTELFGRFDRGFFPILPRGHSADLQVRERAKYLGKYIAGSASLDRHWQAPYEASAVWETLAQWDWDHPGVAALSHPHFSGELHRDRGNAESSALRLAATFPRGKILFMIREQRQAILSAHIKFLRAGGRQGLRPYLKRPGALVLFDYAVHLERLHRIFGPESVMVYPMEMLRADREGFLRALGHFAQAEIPIETLGQADEVNVSRMYLARRLTRVLNTKKRASLRRKVARLACGAVDRSVPDWIEMRHRHGQANRLTRVLGDRFAKSNLHVAKKLGIDLGALGYALPR